MSNCLVTMVITAPPVSVVGWHFATADLPKASDERQTGDKCKPNTMKQLGHMIEAVTELEAVGEAVISEGWSNTLKQVWVTETVTEPVTEAQNKTS